MDWKRKGSFQPKKGNNTTSKRFKLVLLNNIITYHILEGRANTYICIWRIVNTIFIFSFKLKAFKQFPHLFRPKSKQCLL